MCHALHASAGEEDWHRACVTLAQFDVLCPHTGTTVGGIAMCHNHHHSLLCRIFPHPCVCMCVWEGLFLWCYTVRPFVEEPWCGLIHSVGAAVKQWHWFIFFWPMCAIVTAHVLHHASPQGSICRRPLTGICTVFVQEDQLIAECSKTFNSLPGCRGWTIITKASKIWLKAKFLEWKFNFPCVNRTSKSCMNCYNRCAHCSHC